MGKLSLWTLLSLVAAKEIRQNNTFTDTVSDPEAIPEIVPEVAASKHINVCYYTSWAQYRSQHKFFPENINGNLCTHINYAFAFVTDYGSNVRNESRLD